MTGWRPTLDVYVAVAARLLGVDEAAVRRLPRIKLADSALAAPFASFGGQDAYPDLFDQAAVLIAHLAQNHPLPDGNKRAAFLVCARFLYAHGHDWLPQDVDTDAGTVEQIAAGTIDHDAIVSWLRSRTTC